VVEDEVAVLVQAEVARAPAADTVEFVGVGDSPVGLLVQCGSLKFVDGRGSAWLS